VSITDTDSRQLRLDGHYRAIRIIQPLTCCGRDDIRHRLPHVQDRLFQREHLVPTLLHPPTGNVQYTFPATACRSAFSSARRPISSSIDRRPRHLCADNASRPVTLESGLRSTTSRLWCPTRTRRTTDRSSSSASPAPPRRIPGGQRKIDRVTDHRGRIWNPRWRGVGHLWQRAHRVETSLVDTSRRRTSMSLLLNPITTTVNTATPPGTTTITLLPGL